MPGKIVKIEDDMVTLEYPGENRKAKIIEGDYKVGEYVFVTAQIVVMKIPEKEALQSLEAWQNVA
ncbi:HypC/HybG/HupF family hydrogenase formation chaperone [Nanoarchaeota archaeon]